MIGDVLYGVIGLREQEDLTERDICCKFITPAVMASGWDVLSQIREQVFFTKGRIIVRGKLVTRGKAKFAAGRCCDERKEQAKCMATPV